MNLIGNILWVVFGGILLSLGYIFGGLLLCLTIVGIPFGVQIMKLGMFALWPFGGEVVPNKAQPACLFYSMYCGLSSVALRLHWDTLQWV